VISRRCVTKKTSDAGLATEPLPAQLYLWMFMVGEKALGDASTFAAYINCLPS